MEFELKEEHLRFRNKIREFALNEIAPIAEEIDKNSSFPWKTIKKMANMKILGLPIPEEYGGAGLDNLSYIIAVEEVSRVCGSTGLTLAAHTSLAMEHIYQNGNEEQKKKYLVPLAKGEKIGAWSLTEPEAGSDAGSIKTTAFLDGNEYVLNGSKVFATNGSIADIVVVMASTDIGKGAKGISSFVVEKGTEGFTYGRNEDKLGLKGSITSQLFFDNCRIPKENILGKEGEGYRATMRILDGGRISIGAMALGIAQASLDASIEFLKKKKNFGEGYEIARSIVAQMFAEVEAGRLLVYKSAILKDKKRPHKIESAIAKLFCSEVAVRSASNAIQLYGYEGYTRAHKVERYLRDAKLCEIGEGTSEIQRLVIAREILGG
ncbi:MAG: acyl-CoA dehydrogenase family protein [Candidatus Thermoplasmatota archaeon]